MTRAVEYERDRPHYRPPEPEDQPPPDTLEGCICGGCFYCPDGWHAGTNCLCTPDCILEDVDHTCNQVEPTTVAECPGCAWEADR